ncbi:hypothetical protein AMTRI_Chr09g34780 [Amborella trichopoda]|uniref:Syringolide-induced protein 14-1-1 n=1 Tax=Amborella trichopoda TaxID=13333 RepID=W1NL66_AMBTC|nr:uncharacterized protein At1g76070 [Amborella trichopoda]ERM96258.1 hypothetical protein AMTR_s00001p00151610 [Amborella trichopoda]|eukprot:XP_006828842.1 uncharacterized protein At1g76070 [Amborella trichopoda]
MEKAFKGRRGGLFAFLPKQVPCSPGHEKRLDSSSKLRSNTGKGFSGPIVSMIPAEARRKIDTNNSHRFEPTSPKVSCMGQIKHKKKRSEKKRSEKKQSEKNQPEMKEPKKKGIELSKIFQRKKGGRKIEAAPPASEPFPPHLGQMMRFSSRREAPGLANFDWRAAMVDEGGGDKECGGGEREYYSDEERESGWEVEREREEPLVAFSCPIVVAGGAAVVPRKEVNLWKRRTVEPPLPLTLRTKD